MGGGWARTEAEAGVDDGAGRARAGRRPGAGRAQAGRGAGAAGRIRLSADGHWSGGRSARARCPGNLGSWLKSCFPGTG
ncbi:hypothetical protein D5H75_35105 [Bailinhaonella thermotolerans]|uniref:Uncharacterized protein n=1 Tax=Bailinhaonella thermotolerans TaxID=1070861 RepID=A0A3A4A4V6_9ACTN|nr:hypothetical protein D5H75_35105 [Bailinhaonella thermotolerans]